MFVMNLDAHCLIRPLLLSFSLTVHLQLSLDQKSMRGSNARLSSLHEVYPSVRI